MGKHTGYSRFVLLCTLLAVIFTCENVLSAPAENSFVVTSTEASKENGKDGSTNVALLHPVTYEMDIKSNISNRFAKTLVTSKVKNSQTSAKETTFTVVLPEKAFISEFVMEIGGKSYKAYVKEKEAAKKDYDRAIASGQSAGHVAVSARDSNRFTVSINVEAEGKATFLLTYEELLERKNEQYDLVLNIHPGQIVKKLNVEVRIDESRPLKFVKIPSLRSGNEISKNEEKLDPSADIQKINSTTAIVKFSPDTDKQKQYAQYLGGKESEGLSGQFVVQYDVERDPHGGEVLLQDGYFIHFFAPSDLEPLPKHVVFVLDTSGSMGGTKISQLKDAMKSILSELRKGDIVNIIEFNFDASVWDINNQSSTAVPSLQNKYEEPFPALSETNLPFPFEVSDETIVKAKDIIDKMRAYGGTNMIDGLEAALYLTKVGQETSSDKKYQPIMIFLTDGEPNIGMSSTEEIVSTVTKLNSKNHNVPIFSLSFGYGADKEFLKKLSLKNQGFSRHIYEASDASLQLQEFYKQISSPLLSNVEFKYEDEVQQVTKTHFPIYFRGSELVVAGKYKDPALPIKVTCWGPRGPIDLKPVIERPVTSLERLWAYLTVKQTLDKRDSAENKTELTKKALDLALKYSFVTDVTSLVVVKPNDTSAVDTEEASKGYPDYGGNGFSGPGGVQYQTLIAGNRLAGGPGPYGLTTFGRRPSPLVPSGAIADRTLVNIRTEAADVVDPIFGQSSFNQDADTYITTPRPFVALTSTTTKPLLNDLPWLSSALNSNGTLTVGQGTYDLGETSTVATSNDECTKTPLNATGECTLLKDCSEVYQYLTDFQVYQQYFCALDNKYAGVCCPKKQTSN